MNPMVSDPLGSGAVFWGHPGAVNMTRTNYTVHRSMDGGATVRHSHLTLTCSCGRMPALSSPAATVAQWELLNRVTPSGAGYSDMHFIPHGPGGVPYLGVLFQRTLWENGVEGGGYNLAFAHVALPAADGLQGQPDS